MRNIAWALVATAVLATNTGCTGFYLQEFASWRKSLACGACCPYGYRGCRGIGCGDPCGERGYCGGHCACDCGCGGGCMPFGGGCCQDGCWREHCGCVDGPWVQGQCCGPDCGWGCGNGGHGGGCCPCGGAGCDNCCNDTCTNDYGGDCCPCGGEGCDNCCNGGYEDCGPDCGGCETCSSGFCGCVDDGGCQGACWDGTCRRKKCSWLCCLGGCGEVYWNEWVSDPPDCCDPCNCCGNYIDPMFSRHHAQPEHCGDYAGYGHGGHHMHGGHGMQGEVYESYGVNDYTMNRGRSKKSWSVADGFNELFAQQPPRQRRAIHVPAAGMSGPTLAAEPMAPAPRFDGQEQSIARAPRTQAATPQGRVAKQTPRVAKQAPRTVQPAPRTARQQPTPAIEEHEVEGSFKVVEDRAVDEPSNVAATPEAAAAPKVARQPQRKSAPRAARKPTRPTTSRDAARLDRSI